MGQALEILERGELEVLGRLPWSSNQTFLAQIDCEGVEVLAVYKPRRGERPLWDFAEGSLCDRELACFWVSEALGWLIVPPTVVRPGPLGEGMAQLFIDHDPDEHYITLCERYPDRFRQLAAFDIVINNADRKSGHCLRARADDHIWGIDHGVSFHAGPKLRTVIWDFAGEPLSEDLAGDLARLAGDLDSSLGERLDGLLDPEEVDATRRRLARLLAVGAFPPPRSERAFPWPMV